MTSRIEPRKAPVLLRLPVGGLLLAAMAVGSGGCGEPATPVFPVPDGAEALVWEEQNWETGGGSCRLTLWADGRSEMRVFPTSFALRRGDLRPLPGWSAEEDDTGRLSFVRRGVVSESEARQRFRRAWRAGIAHIEPFTPDYLDGGGTRIELHVDGRVEEKVIPLFLGERLGSPDHHRFQAVAEVLGPCEWEAFTTPEVPG